MTQPNPYIIIPSGGPAGPFWGVMRQSGLIVASQIIERYYAELLVTIGNLDQDDFDTVRMVGKYFAEIQKHEEIILGTEDVIRMAIKAIANHVTELTNG